MSLIFRLWLFFVLASTSFGEDVNQALRLAALKGEYSKIKGLVARGAQVNAKDQDDWTPLMFAASKGHVETVKALLQNGAKVDIRPDLGETYRVNTALSGFSALMHASAGGHREVVKLLLENKANVNATGRDLWTPLLIALKNGQFEIAKILIESGADVNAKTKSGTTPLKLATEKGNGPLQKLLLDKGAALPRVEKEVKPISKPVQQPKAPEVVVPPIVAPPAIVPPVVAPPEKMNSHSSVGPLNDLPLVQPVEKVHVPEKNEPSQAIAMKAEVEKEAKDAKIFMIVLLVLAIGVFIWIVAQSMQSTHRRF
jgi:ankyrin repeat protein